MKRSQAVEIARRDDGNGNGDGDGKEVSAAMEVEAAMQWNAGYHEHSRSSPTIFRKVTAEHTRKDFAQP